MDLLNQVVQPEVVSGFLVNHAHRCGCALASLLALCLEAVLRIARIRRVTEQSIETFILMVYRKKNRVGFIKVCSSVTVTQQANPLFSQAITDEPEELLRGFSKVERVLKHLYLTKLYLWPRFHMSIADALSTSQPEMIEMAQPLTSDMAGVQQALLVAMDCCLQELKKAVPSLDLTELTLEQGLFQVHSSPSLLIQANSDSCAAIR
jgi:DNA excision repair protein ERCC-4